MQSLVSANNMKIYTATVAFTMEAQIAFTTLSVCSLFMMAMDLRDPMVVVSITMVVVLFTISLTYKKAPTLTYVSSAMTRSFLHG